MRSTRARFTDNVTCSTVSVETSSSSASGSAHSLHRLQLLLTSLCLLSYKQHFYDNDVMSYIDVKNVEIKIKNVKKRKKRDKNKKRL